MTDTATALRLVSSGRKAGKPARKFFKLTDLGNAERLEHQHGEDMRCCTDVGRFVWDGQKWAADKRKQWQRFASATVRSIYEEAAMCDDPDVRKAISAHAAKSESAGSLSAMAKLAESFEGVVCTIDDLDSHPMLFNALNGTIDLTTGALRPHDRADLLTKVAGTAYDAEATCPVFDAFMAQIFAGDADLIAFIQRFIGYTITGDVREQVLLFAHGGGANGKSTFIDLIIDMMGGFGGYAAPGAPDLLIAKKNDNHPTELADLRGARLVTCVEIGDGKRFDEERVKALTGGDRIKARFMRENFFDFPPTHKLFLAANHKPEVRGTDLAIWRRILLIPFAVTFTEEQKDRTLPAKLRAELPGILAWAVRGCLEWQRMGLKPPPVVTEATDKYRREMDAVGRFIEERCKLDKVLKAGSTALYSAYRNWAGENGEFVISQTKFGKTLGARGDLEQCSVGNHLAGWAGIGLLAAAPRQKSTNEEAEPCEDEGGYYGPGAS